MRRKILYWTLVLALFFGLLCWWFWPRDRLTPENLAKVKMGMSLEQVKELLGEPINDADYDRMVLVQMGPDSHPFFRTYRYEPKSAYLPRVNVSNVAILDDDRNFVWFEKQSGFCVIADDQGAIIKMQPFPVDSTGGGPWNWLKSQYQSWTSSPPKRTVVPPAAVPAPAAVMRTNPK